MEQIYFYMNSEEYWVYIFGDYTDFALPASIKQDERQHLAFPSQGHLGLFGPKMMCLYVPLWDSMSLILACFQVLKLNF